MIALSTAFKSALIALDIDGKTAFNQIDANCKASESILPELDAMLDKYDLKIQDNDIYAIVIGPGSFTGLRIGLALVKGLMASDKTKKVLSITSFDFIAYSYIKQHKPKQDFVVVLNALSGLYFTCSYNKKGDKVGEEKLLNQDELNSLEQDKVGLSEENVASIRINVNASDLLELANLRAKEGKFTQISTLSPIYLRRSQAEDALEQKNIKKS